MKGSRALLSAFNKITKRLGEKATDREIFLEGYLLGHTDGMIDGCKFIENNAGVIKREARERARKIV